MSKFKNFSTCHSHPGSLDSASTPEAFAAREVELGTGTITVTDHGTLSSCRKVYDLGKANSLIPIIGLEAYVRDDNCPILLAAGVKKDEKGTLAAYSKYFHLTMHFLDYEAYQCGVRLLSKADERAERHGSERKPLFDWATLEELGSHNVTFTSSCLIGMFMRHVLDHNSLQNALKYYEKLRSCVKPGNFIVEAHPHDCSKNWVAGVFLTVKQPDGVERKHKWHSEKLLKTNVGEIRASQLAREFNLKTNKHIELQGVKNYAKWEELPPAALESVQHKEEFVENECRDWAVDGDVQAGLNKLVLLIAKKYGDPVTIADDSHFSHFGGKIVQDVRLAQSGNWKMYGSYHRQDSEEAYSYFKSRLGTSEATFEKWIENSNAWAQRFKDFSFDTKPSLPTKFYEPKYELYSWASNPKVAAKDHSLMYIMELIRKHGRMDWKKKEYVDRLQAEIKTLHDNGTIDLLPYFFIDEEVCSFFESQGLITGPGRGSAAGLLLTYVLGITHVDPIRYGLSRERFITEDRIRSGKLPDIDQDLPRGRRELLIDPETGWLKKRFGDHYAQLSVDTTLKLRSAVLDVARFKYGSVPPEVAGFTKRFVMPPMGITDLDFVLGYDNDEGHEQGSIEYDPALKEYVAKYPEDWVTVQACLGLSRGRGRHACHPAGVSIFVLGEEMPRRIEQCDGATVNTGQGAWAKATLLDQGQREVMEYTLEDGTTVRATADHLILTDMGWMQIEEAFQRGAQLVIEKPATQSRISEHTPPPSVENVSVPATALFPASTNGNATAEIASPVSGTMSSTEAAGARYVLSSEELLYAEHLSRK